MATRNLLPVSWNGVSINTAQYASWFEENRPGPHNMPRSVVSIEAGITGRAPGAVRAQPQAETWELTVKLTATDETDVQAMNAIFVEGVQVYLRCTDGATSPVTWRISCHALRAPQRLKGTKNTFVLPIRIADPTWEEDTLNTDTKSNQTASPIAMGTAGVLVNAGTRDADAKITLTADVAKSENSHLNDWPYSFESIWVNRAPNPLKDEPVYLMDQSGAAARIVTDSAASGAVVRRTTNATTIVDGGDGLTASQTTIGVAATAAFNVNGGLATIRWVTGSTFGTMETIYYASFSGLNLTGVVRGVGGTTAQTHPEGAAIVASGTMPNGDDVAVWLDHARYDVRYLVAWNSAASDIVINVTAPAVISLTLTAEMTATVPAVGNTIRFVEGNGALADQGFLLCQNEVFHFSAKSGQAGVVIDGRALWGTTAATHATSALVYANPHRVTVGMGWAKAPAAPAPIASRPCIDLPLSSNLVQRWGWQASDPLTIYYDRAYPGRPKQWTPGYDKDGNDVSPLMSLSASGTLATFKDDAPGDGSPPYNFLEQFFPQGIDAGNANAISNDWTPTEKILNLELFTRDINGTLKLQDQLQRSASAAGRVLPAALASVAYGVKLKGRYNAACAYWGSLVDSEVISFTTLHPDQNGSRAQTFTLSKPIRLKSVWLHMDAVTAAQDIRVEIFPTSSDAPITDATSGTLKSRLLATSTVTTAGGWFEFAPSSVIYLPAGTWAIVAYPINAAGGTVQWIGSFSNQYGNGFAWKRITATANDWDAADRTDLAFILTTEYDGQGTAFIESSDLPIGTPTARTGITASFDNTVLTLEPTQTVYVHRLTGPVTNGGAGAMLHMQCVFANATNGDSLTVDKWMRPTTTLVIDAKAKTCVYTEDGIAYPLLSVLGAAPQLRLSPGDNTVTATDASLIAPGQIDAAMEWRGTRT